jgi:hypothetical protein
MSNEGFWLKRLPLDVRFLNALLLQIASTADRPSPKFKGRWFVSLDDQTVEYDDGGNWVTMIDVDLDASSPSLRTLGTGANQVAVGNHVHG